MRKRLLGLSILGAILFLFVGGAILAPWTGRIMAFVACTLTGFIAWSALPDLRDRLRASPA